MTRAVLAFSAAVLLGTILTIVMGQEPGFLLGFFLIVGSVVASAAVRRGATHKFIPLPALAYLVAATFAGIVHDSSSLNSTRQYLLDFLTWIGGSFVAVTASTILVVLIALGRWLLGGRLVSGQLPAAGRAGSEPAVAGPAARNPRDAREPRDGQQRDNRAPWGNPDSPDGRAARDDRDLRGGRDRSDRRPRGNSDPWENRNLRDEATWANQSPRDDWSRRDEGTWPSQGLRDDRDTWGGRPGDPRDRHDGRDPREDRPPRDLW